VSDMRPAPADAGCNIGTRENAVVGIYLIQNIETSLFYIGQSSNITARWSSHRALLNRGANGGDRHHSKMLQESWNEYGQDSFSFSILERCAVEELEGRERYWINRYQLDYPGGICNQRPATVAPCRGQTRTAESASKMSQSHMNRRLDIWADVPTHPPIPEDDGFISMESIRSELKRQVTLAGGIKAFCRTHGGGSHTRISLIVAGHRPVSEEVANMLGFVAIKTFVRIIP
jgi:group I intron endonuclease